MRTLRLSEIALATGGRLIGGDTSVEAVSTDSREVSKQSLFIPIVGENHDGHSFINRALEKGALAFLSQRESKSEAPYVLVKDTREALGALASFYRRLFDIPVIAVTGSSGKTSVKNGIASVLSQKFNVLKTKGNFNNDIGLPLTVFELTKEHTAAVFEMGMNSIGEISKLSKTVRPDIGVITNVGTAHIGRLGSRDAILRAKLEITDGMSDNGTLILNYDNDMLKTHKSKLKTVWVSACEQSEVYTKNITSTNEGGAGFEVCYGNRTLSATVPINAKPIILNALMSAAAGFLLGLSNEEIERGLAEGASEKRRLEIHKTKEGGVIINDCYNANTESMKLALDILSGYGMKRIAVLGDMFEQGEFAREFHEDIGRYAYTSGTDILIAVGSSAMHYKAAFDELNKDGRESYYFESKRELFESPPDALISGRAAVQIKASRGMEFEEIFEYLIRRGI